MSLVHHHMHAAVLSQSENSLKTTGIIYKTDAAIAKTIGH